ncbi:hypothetical protein O5O45_08065 [Hahella aquimaris]|uniref:hypothetical protein n=1 Tax=Hahella sp. HNIBRBA332 TaxID=3015983 RepID=UPI00273CE394|nr:hypothetical protein [Hahella sp. HNIBRBA332]WLQ15867.1 hypothetical protein O5O45_08065 [Hahella sp. HNIBRBA332]
MRKILFLKLTALLFLLSGCSKEEIDDKIFEQKISPLGEGKNYLHVKIPYDYVSDYKLYSDGSSIITLKFKISDMQPAKQEHIKEDNNIISLTLKNDYSKRNEYNLNRLTEIGNIDHGLRHYKRFGCDMKKYSKDLFDQLGCTEYNDTDYFIPIEGKNSKIRIISCNKVCTADSTYENFNISFSFGKAMLSKWNNVEESILKFTHIFVTTGINTSESDFK